MYVIVLNGPPRSGKDTAVAAILAGRRELNPKITRFAYANILKEMTHMLFGVNMQADAFEDKKDIPLGQFKGLTPREAYISVGTFARELVGEDVFVNLTIKEIQKWWEKFVCPNKAIAVISDCGFQNEIDRIAKVFSPENVLLIQIARKGLNFDKDSRSYVASNDCELLIIPNNGTEQEFQVSVKNLIDKWLIKKGEKAHD